MHDLHDLLVARAQRMAEDNVEYPDPDTLATAVRAHLFLDAVSAADAPTLFEAYQRARRYAITPAGEAVLA